MVRIDCNKCLNTQTNKQFDQNMNNQVTISCLNVLHLKVRVGLSKQHLHIQGAVGYHWSAALLNKWVWLPYIKAQSKHSPCHCWHHMLWFKSEICTHSERFIDIKQLISKQWSPIYCTDVSCIVILYFICDITLLMRNNNWAILCWCLGW